MILCCGIDDFEILKGFYDACCGVGRVLSSSSRELGHAITVSMLPFR